MICVMWEIIEFRKVEFFVAAVEKKEALAKECWRRGVEGALFWEIVSLC